MSNRYRVEFSVFGAAARPSWKRAVVSATYVDAESPEQARELAGYGDATWSVTLEPVAEDVEHYDSIRDLTPTDVDYVSPRD